MYKFSNAEHTQVKNLISGASGIHSGVWMWQEYQDWKDGGGVTEAFDTRTPSQILVESETLVWEKIKAERDKRKDGGFKVNGWWFHSDPPSRVQHLGLVILGNSLPPGVMWKTMSNEFVSLTPTIVTQIFQAGLQLDTALFSRAEYHRMQMELSGTPETYNFSTGWPENFLGL